MIKANSGILLEHFNEAVMFSRVAESRSFTSAARRMNLTPAGISKGVARLETALGVKLLNRSTRSVSLTNDGDILLSRWKEVLQSIQEVESELSLTQGALRGTLKVHAPVGLGRAILMPALLTMAEQHPDLDINTDFSDRVPNMIEEGLDAMIAIGEISDSRLVAKKLARLRFVTCAAPHYLQKWGTPASPTELEHHNCIAYVRWQGKDIRKWVFEKDDTRHFFTPKGNISTNHTGAILDSVLSGRGIANLASFIVASLIISGQLKMILADWVPRGANLRLIYQPSKVLSPRISTFSQYMTDAMPRYLPWEREMGLPPPQ